METVEEIKREISISRIYPKVLKNNRGQCALHENSSSPSFVYYPDNETWHCFSCGVGGDVINLYGHINNLTNSQAVSELSKQYNISFDKEKVKYYKIKDNIKKIFSKFTQLCHENFKSSKLYDEVRKRRGFSKETINMFKIGLFDESINEKLTNKLSKRFLIKAGFLSKKGNNYFGKRIVFPYLNQRGESTYFIYRLINSDKDFMEDAKYIKHRKTEYVKEHLFGINSIAKYRNKPLIITEGITDAISVIQCGYSCLSPVTVKFKDNDIDKICNYAQQFNKVVIINDNEENKRGVKGAERTLSWLISKGVKARIGIIPRPVGRNKIDLDEYLKTNGKKRLETLIKESQEGFIYFCSQVDEDSSQEEIKEILELIPVKDIVKRKKVFGMIKENTNRNVNLGDLEDIYNLIEKEREREKQLQKEQKQTETQERDLEEVIKSFDFRNDLIELREDGIWKVQFTKEGGTIEEQILDGGFELIHKTKYLGRDYFSYKFRDDVFNTQSRTLILMELRNFIYGGEGGKDIIKKVINKLGDELEYKECKSIMGFDNGWVLPQLEEEKDYKILLYTDAQRRVHNNCSDMIQEYSENDKEIIKEKLKKFIKNTQMKKKKLAMIIGWSIASVFKLPILKYYKIFPGLLLQGDRQTGKTEILSFFTVDFYKAWNKYLSGGSIKTEARLEDFLATSTFPIHLDELEYVKYAIIEILKSTLTGVHDYIRKLNLIEEICKPEVAPFTISTNQPPKPFLDPALNSKMIVIDFSSNEEIKDDLKWIKLSNELRDMNLFSLLYEHTKEWTDEDVKDHIFKLEENDDKRFIDNSRLRKKYIIVKFGLSLFKEIYNIDILEYLDAFLFEAGERIISESLLDKFLIFCKKAKHYEEDYEERKEYNDGRTYIKTIHGDNPKYLTCKLYKNNNNVYVFKQDNLRDFNEFTGEDFSMRGLGNLINDGIINKKLIDYGREYLDGVQYRCIIIDEKVFNLDEDELEELGYKIPSEIKDNGGIFDFLEFNKDLYETIIDIIEENEYNAVPINLIKEMLSKRGFSDKTIDINMEMYLEKELFKLSKKNRLEFGDIL